MATKKVTDAVLKDVMKAMSKSYGEGFNTRGLADATYQAIPTGYDDLDSLLTRGASGIYLGGIIELFGGESSGKCITKDTYCLTADGLLTVEEIFQQNDLSCDRKIGFVECEYDILNGDGEFEKTSHFYKNNCGASNLKTINITTDFGFQIEGTYNHPIRVMDELGNIVWKRMRNLKKGDYVCIGRNARIWPKKCKINHNEATLIGYLLSEGTLNTQNRLVFTNTDVSMVDLYKKSLQLSMGQNAVDKIKKYGIDYHLSSKELYKEFVDKYEVDMVKSCYRTIPRVIRSGTREVQSAFIRAYFDGDGTYQPSKKVLQFCSCSLDMLRQLQLMLLNFGIFGHITSIYNKKYDKDYYELEFAGSELILYFNEIGFNDNQKCNEIVQNIKSYKDRVDSGETHCNTNIDAIPYFNNKIKSLYSSLSPIYRSREVLSIFGDILKNLCFVTYSRLDKIIGFCNEILSRDNGKFLIDVSIVDSINAVRDRKFIYSRISHIEKGSNKTYDFTLPNTHSFWSNGFISHNTSVAMRTVGHAQRMGHICCWIDAEAGFSPDLAVINGVDLPKLIMPELSRTKATSENSGFFINSAEMLKMIYDAIMKDVFGLIVVDSVAGMIPERYLQTNLDANSSGMAELARDMSNYLKLINMACQDKKCSVIFINQVRAVPGDMYKKEDTPGGKALKFFASQRIRVSKITGANGVVLDPSTKEIIGHYARISIVKNKKAPPVVTPIEIPIYYREYFPDNAKKCYDYARSLHVITMRNGVLTWKDSDGDIVLQSNGESDILSIIRSKKLEAKLVHACILAESGERNKKLKSPIKIPKTIKDIAEGYVDVKISSIISDHGDGFTTSPAESNDDDL